MGAPFGRPGARRRSRGRGGLAQLSGERLSRIVESARASRTARRPAKARHRGEPSPAVPGPHPSRGLGLAALSAYLFPLSTHSSDAEPAPLSHSLPLSLFLSLSLFPPCLRLRSSFQWRKIIILLNGFARGARTQARAHTPPPEYPINAQIFGVPLTSADDSGS